MKVYKTDSVITVDVDDTLVMWNLADKSGDIPFVDPYVEGMVNYLTPNEKHIDLVKKHHGRGYTVIVWSAGGVEWAETVVKTLELESYVDIVLSKPVKYIDDLPCQEWMGTRLYLK